jgi:putative sigma-54 modulation protein
MTRLVVKGKNIEVTEALKQYVAKKVSRLDKFSQHIIEIVFELEVEKNPRISDNQKVYVNVYVNGAVLRAEESSIDMYASIEMVIDKLDRQMIKYEEKKIRNKTGRLKTGETFNSFMNY